MKPNLSFREWITCGLYRILPSVAELDQDETNDPLAPYSTHQLVQTNWLHRLLFRSYNRRITVGDDDLSRLRDAASHGTLVYATPNIGQLEYQFLAHLHAHHDLPLARFNNGLRQWWWMKWHHLRAVMTHRRHVCEREGYFPDPIECGALQESLVNGDSILVRFKTTQLYDDTLWVAPEEDPLVPLVTAARQHAPIYIITEQFIWDRNPQRSLTHVIFGERNNPGILRRLWMFFWRLGKAASLRVGHPIAVSEIITAHPDESDHHIAMRLRKMILESFSIEKAAITGPALKPKRWVIEHVLESESVQHAIYELSLAKKKELSEVRLLAKKYINEIAADISHYYVDIAQRIVNWVMNNIYDGVEIDEEGLAQLKEMIPHHPVVLVPSHRSHMDYLLLSTILFRRGIAVPFVASGINLSIWPLGHIFRRGGAFFMRRSFRGNPLYRAVFQAYLEWLVREKYCQEFFIEGGRSRTGKLRQPKMGMLAMLTDVMRHNASDELIFIPVSMTYDHVMETHSYANELAGENKRQEKSRDILKLGKYLRRKYGRIYIGLGKPVSFQEIAQSTIGEKEISQMSDDDKNHLVRKLAYGIMNEINRETVVTPTSLMASAVLIHPKVGVPRDSILEAASFFHQYIHIIRHCQSEALEDVDHAYDDALTTFQANRWITAHTDFDPPFYHIDPSKRIELDYCKNTSIHVLLPLAYLSCVLLSAYRDDQESMSHEDIVQQIRDLSHLFEIEFVASNRLSSPRVIENSLAFLKQAGLLHEVEPRRVRIPSNAIPRLNQSARLIANYIQGYDATLRAIEKILSTQAPVSERDLVKMILKYAMKWRLLGAISYPEAISKEMIHNALTTFAQWGAIATVDMEGGSLMIQGIASEEVMEHLKKTLKRWATLFDSQL